MNKQFGIITKENRPRYDNHSIIYYKSFTKHGGIGWVFEIRIWWAYFLLWRDN